MKKRLREGAKLIVIDPRRIDLVRSPHVEADYHLPLQPGTNVAVLTALAHVIVTEGLVDEAFVRERCDLDGVRAIGPRSSPSRATRPEAVETITGVPAADDPRRRPALRHRRQWRDLLRPRRHRAQPGLDHGHGHRQPRDGDRQYRPPRRRREPAARPEQRAGLLRHGLVPARAARLPPHLRRRRARASSRALWGVKLDTEPGLRIPNMLDAAVDGTFKGLYIQGEDILQSDPDTNMSPPASRRWNASSSRTSSSTRPPTTPMSSCPARPSSRRTAPSPMPSAASSAVRKVMAPKSGLADWEVTLRLAQAHAASDGTTRIRPRSWTRSRD